MKLKTPEQIELIRHSAQLVSKTLGMLSKEIKEGVNTLHLDRLAETFIRDHGAIPGFLGMYDFPNTLCISINEEVVHGIPSKRELRSGDLVSIDCGVLKNGFFGDHAYTFSVGEIPQELKDLLRISKQSLYKGIEKFVVGNRIGDIGYAITNHTQGYGVVKNFVGHGIGKDLHEKPQVPNFGRPGRGTLLKNGLVLAIEPMINFGTDKVEIASDRWTVITKDRKPSVHFEHNVALIDGRPEILSTFDYIYEALGITNRGDD